MEPLENPDTSVHGSKQYVEEFSAIGRFPSKEFLDFLEQRVSGSIDRLINLVEAQQKHVHEMERLEKEENLKLINLRSKQLEVKARESLVGQLLGFLLAVGVVAGSMALLAVDKNIGGLTALVGALASLVIVFVAGRLQAVRMKSKHVDSEGSPEDNENVPTASR